MSLKKNYGDTNFITGMRAFAALAVVLIHAGGAGFRELGIVGNNIADFGRTGVYVFFVISGFSVASSYETSNGYLDYINKRLWRIAPLYYFWLTATILIEFFIKGSINAAINFYNIILHILFLGFVDYRITNSIISVEWSISVEVFWYFAVPLLLTVSKGNIKTLLMIIISLIVYQIAIRFPSILPVDQENAGLAMHWSPIPYVLSYSLGIAAFRFRHLCKQSNTVGNSVLSLSLISIAIFIYRPQIILGIFYDEFIFVSLITTVLILFGTNRSFLFRLFFTNQFVQFLGVASYGIYLSHVPLLGLLISLDFQALDNLTIRFLVVSILAVLVSGLTFYFLEQRFVQIGKHYGKRVLTSKAT